MKHRHETEIKLYIHDPKALKRRLRNLGFEVARPRYFESNYLFDFPDLRLRKARCLLRLRLAGRQGLLTFKGTPLRSQFYKIRREIETVIDDGHGLREILESIGLEETFSYEKYRTVYAPRGKREISEAPFLVYDETPIGNYIELEGPERWIDEVATQLGYEREDYIASSYGALYRQKCLARGRKPGNMAFSRRRLHHKS
jgi:adenylate cyclase class 2